MPHSSSITTCLFDMDGTLIDSEVVWVDAIQAALETKGIHLTRGQVFRLEYGRAWQEIFQDIRTQWPHAFRTIGEMEALTVPYYERVTASRDISIPGSVALLRRLAEEGYAIGIVSGSTRGRIATVMGQLGIGGLVRGYLGNGDYVNGKPAPDSYLAGARLLGASPQQCIVFEDSPAGIAAAKNAGMLCVALTPDRSEGAPGQDVAERSLGPDAAGCAADLVLPDLSLFSFDMLASAHIGL